MAGISVPLSLLYSTHSSFSASPNSTYPHKKRPASPSSNGEVDSAASTDVSKASTPRAVFLHPYTAHTSALYPTPYAIDDSTEEEYTTTTNSTSTSRSKHPGRGGGGGMAHGRGGTNNGGGELYHPSSLPASSTRDNSSSITRRDVYASVYGSDGVSMTGTTATTSTSTSTAATVRSHTPTTFQYPTSGTTLPYPWTPQGDRESEASHASSATTDWYSQSQVTPRSEDVARRSLPFLEGSLPASQEVEGERRKGGGGGGGTSNAPPPPPPSSTTEADTLESMASSSTTPTSVVPPLPLASLRLQEEEGVECLPLSSAHPAKSDHESQLESKGDESGERDVEDQVEEMYLLHPRSSSTTKKKKKSTYNHRGSRTRSKVQHSLEDGSEVVSSNASIPSLHSLTSLSSLVTTTQPQEEQGPQNGEHRSRGGKKGRAPPPSPQPPPPYATGARNPRPDESDTDEEPPRAKRHKPPTGSVDGGKREAPSRKPRPAHSPRYAAPSASISVLFPPLGGNVVKTKWDADRHGDGSGPTHTGSAAALPPPPAKTTTGRPRTSPPSHSKRKPGDARGGKVGQVVRVSLAPLATPTTATSLRTHRSVAKGKKRLVHRIDTRNPEEPSDTPNPSPSATTNAAEDAKTKKKVAPAPKTMRVMELGKGGWEAPPASSSVDPAQSITTSSSPMSKTMGRTMSMPLSPAPPPLPPPLPPPTLASESFSHSPSSSLSSHSHRGTARDRSRHSFQKREEGRGSLARPSYRGSVHDGGRKKSSPVPFTEDAFSPIQPDRSTVPHQGGGGGGSSSSGASGGTRRSASANSTRSRGRRSVSAGKRVRPASHAPSPPPSTDEPRVSSSTLSYVPRGSGVVSASNEWTQDGSNAPQGKKSAREKMALLEEEVDPDEAQREAERERLRRALRRSGSEDSANGVPPPRSPSSPGPLPLEAASPSRGGQGGGGGGTSYAMLSSRPWTSPRGVSGGGGSSTSGPGVSAGAAGSLSHSAADVPFFIGRGTIGIEERLHPELYQHNPPLTLLQWTVIYRKRGFEERELKRRAAYQAWRAAALGRSPMFAKGAPHSSQHRSKAPQESSASFSSEKRVLEEEDDNEGGEHPPHRLSQSSLSDHVLSAKRVEEACLFNGDKGKYNNTNRRTISDIRPHGKDHGGGDEGGGPAPSSSLGPAQARTSSIQCIRKQRNARMAKEEQERQAHEEKVLSDRRRQWQGEGVQLPPAYYHSAHQRLLAMNVSGTPADAKDIQVHDHYKAQKMAQLQIDTQRTEMEEARRFEGTQQRRAIAEAVAASREEILTYNRSLRDWEKAITARRRSSRFRASSSRGKKEDARRPEESTGRPPTTTTAAAAVVVVGGGRSFLPLHTRTSLPGVDGRGAVGRRKSDTRLGVAEKSPGAALTGISFFSSSSSFSLPHSTAASNTGGGGGHAAGGAHTEPATTPAPGVPFPPLSYLPPPASTSAPVAAPPPTTQTRPPTRPNSGGAYLHPPGAPGGSSVQPGPTTTHLVDEIQMWKKTFRSPLTSDQNRALEGMDKQKRQEWLEDLEKNRIAFNVQLAERQREARQQVPLSRERWYDRNVQMAEEERAEKLALEYKREEASMTELAYKEKQYEKQRRQADSVREAVTSNLEKRRQQAAEVQKVEALLQKEKELADARILEEKSAKVQRVRWGTSPNAPTVEGSKEKNF